MAGVTLETHQIQLFIFHSRLLEAQCAEVVLKLLLSTSLSQYMESKHFKAHASSFARWASEDYIPFVWGFIFSCWNLSGDPFRYLIWDPFWYLFRHTGLFSKTAVSRGRRPVKRDIKYDCRKTAFPVLFFCVCIPLC